MAGRVSRESSTARRQTTLTRTAKPCGPVVQHFFRSPKIEENA
jgi:hypothetical protein